MCQHLEHLGRSLAHPMLVRSFGYFIFSRLSRLLWNSGSALLVSKTARCSLTVFGLYLCISHFFQSLEKKAVTSVDYVDEQKHSNSHRQPAGIWGLPRGCVT